MPSSAPFRTRLSLAVTLALALSACSGDDAKAPASGGDEDDITEETDTSPGTSADAGTKPPGQTGSTGNGRDAGNTVSKDAGQKPVDAGTIVTGRLDGGSGGTVVPMNGMDASTPPDTSSGRPVATSLTLPIVVEPHLQDQPVFNVTRPMDLSQAGGKAPVIVWANGGCFRSDFTWSPLFERWAAAGFVVLHLSAASDNIFAMLGTTSKADHGKLIDWVVAQDKSGPYAGKLDLERIVIAGNSCGGVTALELASTDTRGAAVFVLSGSSAVGSVDEAIMKGVKVPVGYVVGGEEDIAGANAKGDYEAMNEGVPAMIVSRREGDHQTVSTDEKILPEDAEIALNFMDLALYGTKAAHEALTSPNVCIKCTPGDWTLKSKHLETLVK